MKLAWHLSKTENWSVRQAIGTLALDIEEWSKAVNESLDLRKWREAEKGIHQILQSTRKLEAIIEKVENSPCEETKGKA